MKVYSLLLVVFGLLVLTGCSQNEGGAPLNISSENGNVITEGNKTVVESDGNKVEIEGNKAEVTFQNKSVNVENLSITQEKDGTYEVNLSVKNNVTLPPEVAIEKWCVAGNYYEVEDPNSKTVSKARILGIETFKSKTFCKAESKTNVYGMDILTIYYFDYGAKDVWAVVNAAGQINEVHINNK